MTELHAVTGDDEPAPADAGKRSQASQLLDIAAHLFDFVTGAEGELFGVSRYQPGVAVPLRGGRSSVAGHLRTAFYATHNRAPSSSAVADAMSVIEASVPAARRPVHLRVASHDDGLVLDLGSEPNVVKPGAEEAVNPDPRPVAAVVRPGGWETVLVHPALFRRTALTSPLPAPERGGSLDELRGLLNVADPSWPLLLAWLVAALVPEIPHPVVLLTGESGTGKSTAARHLAGLVDPSGAQLRTAPRDVEGWAVAISGSWVAAIDNVSTIADWFSDALCRTVTGDGMVRRRLYSDSDLSILAYRRCLLITSIDSGALRGDLADRLVTVELERIPPARRRRDEEIAAAFTAAHPRILGALLDLAAGVLKALPDVRLAELPRMADFARIVAAVDRVLGTDGLGTYLGQGARLAEEVVESDPVATAVRALVEPRRPEWTGTAAELLAALEPHRPDPRPKGWPATPRGVSGALRRAAPSLRAIGVGVEERRTNRARVLTITDRGVGQSTVTTVTPSPRADDQRKRGDGTGDGSRPGDGTTVTTPPTVTTTVTTPNGADQQEQATGDGGDGGDGRIPTPSVRDRKLAKLAARRATDPTLLDGE